MTKARKSQISLDDTRYYHCVSRCVRRAFLCGEDKLTDKNFDHRKQWLVERIKKLANIFAIDIAAYAIMSNHYHLVLHVNRDKAANWDETEVLQRWGLLCQHKPIVARVLKGGDDISEIDRIITRECAADYRERLISISWFMRFLNEHIARLANREDNCTGRFWEGRFKSQALLDQTAILACMAYVDLNPIRAKMADTPETSDFTSIQERLGIQPSQLGQQTGDASKDDKQATIVKPLDQVPLAELQAFAGNSHIDNDKHLIQYELINYLALVDWTGRQLHPGKRGAINDKEPEILKRIGITAENWLDFASHIEQGFTSAIGSVECIRRYGKHTQRKRVVGTGTARRYYAMPAALRQ